MKLLVWVLLIGLVVAHQDVWFWDDAGLAFGFLPVTLLYHAGISLGATLVWLLAATFAWPVDESEERRLVPANERPIPKEKTNWRQGGADPDAVAGAPA